MRLLWRNLTCSNPTYQLRYTFDGGFQSPESQWKANNL